VARTSKHILIFAFGFLSLYLSLLYLASLLLVHIIYMLGIICVPTLVLNQESF